MVHNNKKELDLQGLILVIITVAWLAGILLSYWRQLPPEILLIGAAVALVGVIVLWRSDPGVLLSLVVLWLLLGAWRCAIASPVVDPQAISAFIGTKKLDVRGSIVSEPILEARSRLLTVDVHSVSTDNGSSWRDAHGRINVMILGSFIDDPYGPNYGDDVELKGKLEVPPPHNTPDIIASMAFPGLRIDAKGANPVIAAIFHLRITLANIILQSLPQPLAALLIAILLSLRTPALIPLAPAFNETGTAHLIAPSGFKVTILAGLTLASTRWLYEKRDKQEKLLPAQKRRDWRRWLATILPLLTISVYTLLSGAGPAAIRAGIMGSMLIIAPRIGRIYNVYTALAFTALLMSMVDPFVLWDPGFQLSFVGTLGIVLLSPPLLRLFHVLESFPFGHYIAEIIAVSLAAQLATWPITALTFSQISFIAPLTNVLVVPFFGVSISLGILLCAGGLFFPQSAILIGWIARPLLLYLNTIIGWCFKLPLAFRDVRDINVNMLTAMARIYYGLLILMICVLFVHWPEHMRAQTINNASTYFSRRIWLLLQLSAALIIILATGVTVLAAHSEGQLTITFLNVGPAGQSSPEGESILIQTPDGKTILIDGGFDASSLAKELSKRLPCWQHSLDAIILTTPRQDHLIGLQDVITRYQVGEVIDAGMLHPNTAYALWRRTISDRGFTYVQVRQHATISLGTQVMLQVLGPPSPLHKSSDEALDNALILRLVAPGFRMLLLGAGALSKYALNELLSTPDPSFLQANVVQIVGEVGKAFPGPLSSVLQLAHPSYLVISPAALNAKQHKAHQTSTITPAPFAGASWQVIQTAQEQEGDTIEISSTGSGWNLVEKTIATQWLLC